MTTTPAPVEVTPSAWLYEGPAMLEDETIIHDQKYFPKRMAYKPGGWTETPLYTAEASQHGTRALCRLNWWRRCAQM